jgi:hypothetical protein
VFSILIVEYEEVAKNFDRITEVGWLPMDVNAFSKKDSTERRSACREVFLDLKFKTKS